MTDTTNMGPMEVHFYKRFDAEFPGAEIHAKLRRLDKPVEVNGDVVAEKEYIFTMKFADGTEKKGSVLWDYEWGTNLMKFARGTV